MLKFAFCNQKNILAGAADNLLALLIFQPYKAIVPGLDG
jgi:hypothetical protein